MPRRKQTEGEKKIDISQMAEDLGVSKTTVSRALSGNGRVSEATRARVVQYAKEKNYVPNMLARGLVPSSLIISHWCSRASSATLPHHFCAKPSAPCTILPPAMIMMC